jgi:hypothetical protein
MIILEELNIGIIILLVVFNYFLIRWIVDARNKKRNKY